MSDALFAPALAISLSACVIFAQTPNVAGIAAIRRRLRAMIALVHIKEFCGIRDLIAIRRNN